MRLEYLKSVRSGLRRDIKKYLRENQESVQNQFHILVSNEILSLNKDAFGKWIMEFAPRFQKQRKNAGEHAELIDLITEYVCAEHNIILTENKVRANLSQL